MTDAGYVLAGYGITFGGIAVYAWRIVTRGRRVSATVPRERRRWM